jgi:hypothetical protein
LRSEKPRWATISSTRRLEGDVLSCRDEALADAATGTGWECTPWRATQRAAWEALKKAETG